MIFFLHSPQFFIRIVFVAVVKRFAKQENADVASVTHAYSPQSMDPALQLIIDVVRLCAFCDGEAVTYCVYCRNPYKSLPSDRRARCFI